MPRIQEERGAVMEFVSAYEIRKNRTIEEATEENDTPHKIPEGSTPLEELGKLLELKGAVRPYVTGEGPFLMLPIPGEKDGAVMLELGSRKEGTVSLDYINVVEELRGKGYAGDALDVIGGIADDFEFPIYLTIDDRATPRAVVEKFYKKHGFVEVD